jgi:hypothetical protein
MCENPETTEAAIEAVGDTTPGLNYYTWTFTINNGKEVQPDTEKLDRYCIANNIVQSFPMGSAGVLLSMLLGQPEICVAWSVKPFDFTEYKALTLEVLGDSYDVDPNWRPLVGSEYQGLINEYIEYRKPLLFDEDGNLLQSSVDELNQALEDAK